MIPVGCADRSKEGSNTIGLEKVKLCVDHYTERSYTRLFIPEIFRRWV